MTYKDFPLYKWQYSVIDIETAFFYFLNEEDGILMCIEYWADKDKVAPCWWLYSKKGELMCEEAFDLTSEQQEYFSARCRSEITKQ